MQVRPAGEHQAGWTDDLGRRELQREAQSDRDVWAQPNGNAEALVIEQLNLAAAPTMVAVPEMRRARVIRSAPTSAPTAGGREITLEFVQLGIRIAVETGADRATLAMVLDVLGVGAAR